MQTVHQMPCVYFWRVDWLSAWSHEFVCLTCFWALCHVWFCKQCGGWAECGAASFRSCMKVLQFDGWETRLFVVMWNFRFICGLSLFYLKLLGQWLLYFFVLLFRLWTLESSAVLSAEHKMRFSVLSFSLVCSLLKVAISVQVQVVSHCAEQLPFHALVDIDTKIAV